MTFKGILMHLCYFIVLTVLWSPYKGSSISGIHSSQLPAWKHGQTCRRLDRDAPSSSGRRFPHNYVLHCTFRMYCIHTEWFALYFVLIFELYLYTVLADHQQCHIMQYKMHYFLPGANLCCGLTLCGEGKCMYDITEAHGYGYQCQQWCRAFHVAQYIAIVQRCNHKGLHQVQNSIVLDEDLCGRNVALLHSTVLREMLDITT